MTMGRHCASVQLGKPAQPCILPNQGLHLTAYSLRSTRCQRNRVQACPRTY